MNSQPPDVLADDVESVPLPEVGSSGRKRRRREQAKVRRRRRVQLTAVAVAAVVAAGAFVTRDRSGDPSRPEAAAERPVPAAPPALLVVAGPDGRATSVTLLVPDAEPGGTVVFIPPGTMTEIASLGIEPVARSLELGGPQRLLATVENVLGAGIGEIQVVDDAGMADLVERAGELDIRIPERVENVTPGGQVEILYEAGPTTVQPSEIPALLAAKGGATDLSRLARHQAFWNAWFERMREDPSTVPPAEPGLRKAMSVMARGPVQGRILPVSSMGTTEEGELYRIEREQVRALAKEMLPSTSSGARPTVQILNGTGEVQLAQRVSDVLVPEGIEVKLTGNAASFQYEQTQIVFYRQEKRAAAERVQKALGVGRLVFSRRPLDVVDVTVIVGKDFTEPSGST